MAMAVVQPRHFMGPAPKQDYEDLVEIHGVYMTRAAASAYAAQIYPQIAHITERKDHGPQA